MSSSTPTPGSNIRGTQTPQWWRWPVLPFASTVGAFAGSYLLTLAQWFGMKLQGGYTEDGWYYQYVLPIISAAAFGALYAHISLNVAPRAKIIAATVMTTILAVLLSALLVVIWMSPRTDVPQAIQATIGVVASVVAAIVTVVGTRDDYRE